MYIKYKIVHAVPGRMRLSIPLLGTLRDHNSIKDMFESITGIKDVRIEPRIQAMVITYDHQEIDKKLVLKDIGLFFSQAEDDIMPKNVDRKQILIALAKSIVSGILILIAYLRRNGRVTPDLFDYLVVISTSYTVLSHGENRLSHPDVLTGIISMVSLGAQKILSVSLMAWIVNFIEVLVELRNSFRSEVFSI